MPLEEAQAITKAVKEFLLAFPGYRERALKEVINAGVPADEADKVIEQIGQAVHTGESVST
jgi:hypothetical protein